VLLSHRALYYALVVSVVLHAAMLVNLHVRQTSVGQAGSEFYVSAKLSDTRATPLGTTQTVSRQSSAPDDDSIVTAMHSTELIPALTHPADKPEAKDTANNVARQAPPDSGSISAASGNAGYLATVLQRIDANKTYPYLAWRNRIEGNVDIRMDVNPDGTVNVLDAESDSAMLAKAAKQAISKAQPFPPPRKNDAGTPIRLSFTMEFTIRD
jgi:TonB family protein